MFNKMKYALKVAFTIPKPKIVETKYIREKRSWEINYNKYYTKKERFYLSMWSITMLALLAEGLAYMIMFWDSFVRLALIAPILFFYMISMKNSSRMREKYRKKALEDGQYGG